MRKRLWWAAGSVVLVGLITAGVLTWSGGGLTREVTADPGGRIEYPSGTTVTMVFDDSADDTAYAGFLLHQRLRLAAIRAGSDEPLWHVGTDHQVDSVKLAMAGGVLLAMTTCAAACERVIAVDPANGQELWTSSVPAAEVADSTGEHVVMRTSADGMYSGFAVLDLRTGRVAWQVDSGTDYIRLVPGTDRVAHYAADGRLRLADIASGRTEVSIDVQPFEDGVSAELTTSADDVVLGFSGSTQRATVYSSTGLDERWSRDSRVYPLGPNRFFAGDGSVVDGDGREVWRTTGQVFRNREVTDWVYSIAYDADSDDERTRYLDLATGDQLADDVNTLVHAGQDGVLQVGTPLSEQGLRLWHVELPSGDRTDLGEMAVYRETCGFSDSHVACLDTENRFGMWGHT